MDEEFPLRHGGVGVVAQISPCVGGFVRTWSEGGSQLWAVPDDTWLVEHQHRGVIARTSQEPGRYREAGVLYEQQGVLVIQSRYPVSRESDGVRMQATVVQLEPVSAQAMPRESLDIALEQAIDHCVKAREFLVVEKGGWDAPPEPFCLFATVSEPDGLVNIVEAGPQPVRSQLWAPWVTPGAPSVVLSAPSGRDTNAVVPLIMSEAILEWDLEPWDLAFTFGQLPPGPSNSW
jgi:hypothetical protein